VLQRFHCVVLSTVLFAEIKQRFICKTASTVFRDVAGLIPGRTLSCNIRGGPKMAPFFVRLNFIKY